MRDHNSDPSYPVWPWLLALSLLGVWSCGARGQEVSRFEPAAGQPVSYERPRQPREAQPSPAPPSEAAPSAPTAARPADAGAGTWLRDNPLAIVAAVAALLGLAVFLASKQTGPTALSAVGAIYGRHLLLIGAVGLLCVSTYQYTLTAYSQAAWLLFGALVALGLWHQHGAGAKPP